MTGYDWLNSEYGGENHAFTPEAHPDQPYVEAPCEHTAPRSKVHPLDPNAPYCVACVVAVGSQITDEQDWLHRR